MKDFTRFFNIFSGRGRIKVVEKSFFPWENKRKILHKYDVESWDDTQIERCEIISNIKNFIRIFPFISKFQTSTTFRLEFILLKFSMSRSNFLCLSSQISLTYCMEKRERVWKITEKAIFLKMLSILSHIRCERMEQLSKVFCRIS